MNYNLGLVIFVAALLRLILFDGIFIPRESRLTRNAFSLQGISPTATRVSLKCTAAVTSEFPSGMRCFSLPLMYACCLIKKYWKVFV